MPTYADDRIGRTIYADNIKLLKLKERKTPSYTAQRAGLQLMSVDYSELINRIDRMDSDSIITPQEKTILKSQWESLNALRMNTLNNAERFGIENQTLFLEYISAYDSLASTMNFILDPLNMDKDADLSEQPDLSTLFEAYYQKAVLVDEKIFRYETGMIGGLDYRVRLDVLLRASIDPLPLDGTPSVLSVTVKRDGEDVTSEYEDSCFTWSRSSEDKNADAIWNSNPLLVGKSISVTVDDLVYGYATFLCEFHYNYSETMYIAKTGIMTLSKEIPGPPGEDSISVQIFSSNGNIFRNGQAYTIMTATVWQGDDDITSQIDASKFTWERTSGNAVADESWNTSSKAIGHKSIELTPEDIIGRSVFACHVDI